MTGLALAVMVTPAPLGDGVAAGPCLCLDLGDVEFCSRMFGALLNHAPNSFEVRIGYFERLAYGLDASHRCSCAPGYLGVVTGGHHVDDAVSCRLRVHILLLSCPLPCLSTMLF